MGESERLFEVNIRTTGDRFTYEAESETKPGKWYRVDLVANRGGMACACRDHQTRRQPALDKGQPILTRATLCKHTKAVAWHFLREVLPALALTEDSPKRFQFPPRT